MIVYTCQLAKHRQIPKGYYALDITVKSGDKSFAPTWELLNTYKGMLESGAIQPAIAECYYKEVYHLLMIKSFYLNRKKWMKLVKEKQPVVLMCYCKSNTFCHRHLLLKYLRRLCIKNGIPFEYKGEING